MINARQTVKIDWNIIVGDLFIRDQVRYLEDRPLCNVDSRGILGGFNSGGVLILVLIGLLVDDGISEEALVQVVERCQVG